MLRKKSLKKSRGYGPGSNLTEIKLEKLDSISISSSSTLKSEIIVEEEDIDEQSSES